jgi:hypothetical protein
VASNGSIFQIFIRAMTYTAHCTPQDYTNNAITATHPVLHLATTDGRGVAVAGFPPSSRPRHAAPVILSPGRLRRWRLHRLADRLH